MVSKPSGVLSNFKVYNYWENDPPDSYQRQANCELHHVVDPRPASYTCVFPQIAGPVLIVNAGEKRKAVVDYRGLPEQNHHEESRHQPPIQWESIACLGLLCLKTLLELRIAG